jgi:hypothetical protein
MSLEPCPSCARHVRAIERACPFCGASTEVALSRATPSERLGRAALFVFGTAMATSAGCSATTTQQLDSGVPDDSNVADAGAADGGQQDSGFFPPYGTPPPQDAGHDSGGLMGAYGAPPPRDAGSD